MWINGQFHNCLSPFRLLSQNPKDKIYFSLFWNLGSSRSRPQQIVWRPASWFLCLCPHLVEGPKEISAVSFIKTLISFIRTHPYDQITSQRLHIQMPPHWGLGFKQVNIGETRSVHGNNEVIEYNFFKVYKK